MIAGLILAAGESRRMGRDKVLLTYHGRTFLETILAQLLDAGVENVAVVLGHHAEAIRAAVDLGGARVVFNSQYSLGQTSSLQAGLAALEASTPDAVVLCLGDHPAISARVIRLLVERFEPVQPPAVIPTHGGRPGHPVVIGRALFPELLALSAAVGADTVMHKYRDSTHFVEVGDPGILLDVDDPDGYAALVKREWGVESGE